LVTWQLPWWAGWFLLARRAAGYRRWLSARGIAPLLEYLESAGLAGPAEPAPGGGVLTGFREYLLTERGLAASTVRNSMPPGCWPPGCGWSR
jgi:hypothetical protein